MKGNVDDVEAYLVEYQPYEQNGAGVRRNTLKLVADTDIKQC